MKFQVLLKTNDTEFGRASIEQFVCFSALHEGALVRTDVNIADIGDLRAL